MGRLERKMGSALVAAGRELAATVGTKKQGEAEIYTTQGNMN